MKDLAQIRELKDLHFHGALILVTECFGYYVCSTSIGDSCLHFFFGFFAICSTDVLV